MPTAPACAATLQPTPTLWITWISRRSLRELAPGLTRRPEPDVDRSLGQPMAAVRLALSPRRAGCKLPTMEYWALGERTLSPSSALLSNPERPCQINRQGKDDG